MGSAQGPGCYLGLDLGWTTGSTGAACVDETGALVEVTRVRTDDEIAAWVRRQPGRPPVVGVDAPLVVPNETGMRRPERLMASTFGRYGASAHVSNRAKFGGDPRAKRLADAFGWTVDPEAPVGERTVCLEVYPHPAMVGLFGLGYRLDYKSGDRARRTPGFAALVGHLEAIAELQVTRLPRWTELRRIVADPAPGDLDRIEDELDAVLCAHLAWLWQHRPHALQVYGSLEEGYIVAPPPPTHPAVPPR